MPIQCYVSVARNSTLEADSLSSSSKLVVLKMVPSPVDLPRTAETVALNRKNCQETNITSKHTHEASRQKRYLAHSARNEAELLLDRTVFRAQDAK